MTRVALTALAAFVLVCAIASADTYKGTLGPTKTSFKWAGHGVGSPVTPCSNDGEFRCDSVLFTLEVKGDLTVAVDVEGSQIGAYPDFDLYLFRSDASGAKSGDAVAQQVSPSDDEKLTAAGLDAGNYLLEVHAPISVGEDYDGSAKLTNFAAPPIATAPSRPPAGAPKPASKPSKSKSKSSRARCRAKARKVKSKRKRAAAMRRCNKRKR